MRGDASEESLDPATMGQEMPLEMKDLYDSILYKSTNPDAVTKYKLDSRDGTPSPPNCPGDNDQGFDHH